MGPPFPLIASSHTTPYSFPVFGARVDRICTIRLPRVNTHSSKAPFLKLLPQQQPSSCITEMVVNAFNVPSTALPSRYCLLSRTALHKHCPTSCSLRLVAISDSASQHAHQSAQSLRPTKHQVRTLFKQTNLPFPRMAPPFIAAYARIFPYQPETLQYHTMPEQISFWLRAHFLTKTARDRKARQSFFATPSL